MKDLLKDYTKEDSSIFNSEFNDFLPEKIIDFHVHLWKKEFLIKEISKKRQEINPFMDKYIIDGFTSEDFKYVSKKLFPGKEYSGLFFGLPIKEMDFNKANQYISDICVKNTSYGLFVPEKDLKKIPDDFFEKKFIGFKPYPDLTQYDIPKDFSGLDIDVSIFDFISKEVLEFSEENRLILLIHIPRKDRLNDRRNIEEIGAIAKKYPNIKIILAHAGRSYCYSDIKDSIEYLKDFKNLYVDTAMINDFSVNKLLIKKLGIEKILYGTDLAIAALKGKNIEINNKHYFVTSIPHAWSLSSTEMILEHFTYFIYEIVRAIKIAVESLNLSKEHINNIFYMNAKKIIEDITNKNA